MDIMTTLEKKFGRFGLPNVTIYLVAGQRSFICSS